MAKLPLSDADKIINTTLRHAYRVDPKVIRFIAGYMQSRSVQDAAKLAGITVQTGKSLLNKKDVYECVQRLTTLNAQQLGFDATEILTRLNEIAQFDPINLYNEDGTVKRLHDMDGATRRAIKEMTVKEIFEKDINGMPVKVGELINFKFHDKIKSSELLGSEVELFKKTVKHEHDIGKNAADLLLKSAEERALEAAKDVTVTRYDSDSVDNYKIDRFDDNGLMVERKRKQRG